MMPADSPSAKPSMWNDVYLPDLELAADKLAVTITALQWSDDKDAQSAAAEALRELSGALREFFEIKIDPLREQNDMFQKRIKRTTRDVLQDSKLESHELAHCSDAHLRMIRGMRNDVIADIRATLEYLQLHPVEPTLDLGIFNAHMRGIAGAKGAWETPHKLWDVELGDLADRGEERTLADHKFDAREQAYVRAIFRKLKRLK